jgi:hypothetical protein
MPLLTATRRPASAYRPTTAKVRRADRHVRGELRAHGFWTPELEDVDVQVVSRPTWGTYAWYVDGRISVAAWSGARLWDWLGARHMTLRDLLRHEWAHAVAAEHPALIRSKVFCRAFGGSYERDKAVGRHHQRHHVTRYAAANPCEDFAEVFHLYLRHRGRLPLQWRELPVVARKWKFVEDLARVIGGVRKR